MCPPTAPGLKRGCEEINLNMHRLSSFFNVILRQVAPFWRRTFEGPNTILGLLHKATLLVFDGLTKERCIAADLVAKEVKTEVWFIVHGFVSEAVLICAAEG